MPWRSMWLYIGNPCFYADPRNLNDRNPLLPPRSGKPSRVEDVPSVPRGKFSFSPSTISDTNNILHSSGNGFPQWSECFRQVMKRAPVNRVRKYFGIGAIFLSFRYTKQCMLSIYWHFFCPASRRLCAFLTTLNDNCLKRNVEVNFLRTLTARC